MTLRELRLRTAPHMAIFPDDPLITIKIGRILDSNLADLRGESRPSTIPWGYERISRESTRG